MILIVINRTSTNKNYLSGQVVIPGNSSLTVNSNYYYDLITDAQFRNDLVTSLIDVSDGVTNYGSNDGIKYIDSINGTRGITSTEVTTGGGTVKQALDVNIANGSALGYPDETSFTYGITSIQAIGGPYNDSGAALTPGQAGAVRLTSQRAMHINLRDSSGNELGSNSSPINTQIISPPSKSIFNNVTSVANGIQTSLISYTVPSGKTAYLQRFELSGSNIAQYDLFINSILNGRKRTYFGGDLNTDFNFTDSLGLGLPASSGSVIEIKITHNRPFLGDFEARLQVIEE